MRRRLLPRVLAGLALLASTRVAAAPSVPSGFTVENAVPGTAFVVPTGMCFLPDGRMLVAEKGGTVWMVQGGVRLPNPVWSAPAEVLDNWDRGLLDVAVDPAFFLDHYVYFLYTVDPDSDGVDTDTLAFGRLTRYQMSASGDTNTVDPASRTILMGSGWRDSPLTLYLSHTIGSLRWGRDGSLFVSDGEGANFDLPDPGGLQPAAFGPDGADPYFDIGAFRAQDITSLNGKVLRIDPHTGLGYASNPYYDGDPTSARSRVWVYGLRNPFRFTVRPGTGVTDPAAGNPGTVVIGDVGWNTYEEMDVVTQPGQNFGWPCWEGMNVAPSYPSATPAHNGCDSYGTATNPVNPTLPVATWHHSNPLLSSPPGAIGATAIGGAFYTDTLYPASYRGAYFFGDYDQQWVKVATLDANGGLVAINDFGTTMDAPVCFATDPLTGDVCYVSITTGEVRRIRWTGSIGGDTPPVAVATGTPTTGVAPLAVAFDGSASSDADGDSLTWAWTFGDGGTSAVRNPQHTYPLPGAYTAVLTVSDGRGGQAQASVGVTVSSPSGFPSTPVLDTFDRADGPMGPSWGDANSGLAIAGNTLAQAAAGWYDAVWLPAAFGADQEAYVTLATVSTATPELDLMLKVQGTTWTSGLIEVRHDPSLGQVNVSTYDGTAGWRTWLSLANEHLASGDQLGARAYATGVVDVFVNGALAGSANVSAWPGYANGGAIGLEMGSATASRMDAFGGGTWVPSPSADVTLLAPVGGESWTGGSPQTVRWTASAATGVSNVDVFYRDADGAVWTPVALAAPDSGTFTWYVPDTPTATARVRVLAHTAGGGSGADSSHSVFAIARPPGGRVPTTLRDFREPGTQPFEGGTFQASGSCATCHANYDPAVEPGHNWSGTMMAQAARDPLFHACLAVAEQDAPASGDLCIRCHAPFSWLTGGSEPTNGARIDATGRDGVSCDFCHRLVDPVYQPGVNPSQDQQVLAMLPAHVPTTYGNGQYVVDPTTVKRGPFADATPPHAFLASSFHERSDLCGTCHDVSNPVFQRTSGAHYAAGPFDAPADSISPLTLMPLERTYSEWKASAYPAGVYAPDLAGNAPGGIVSTCQDCHLRQVTGRGCSDPSAPLRSDLPLHDMTGGNAWMGGVIASLDPAETDSSALADASARASGTLRKAAALDATIAAEGDSFALSVKVTNLTGHKLPTGYPEGRRMWIGVVARDGAGQVVFQSGAYDAATGTLAPDPFERVYEASLGLSPGLAGALGLAAGPTFHFALDDTVYKDNRIPPLGFTNAAYAAFGGAPVDPGWTGMRYPDGRNWDVATYPLPAATATAAVTLWYQTASREYVEFLQAQDATNAAGQAMYDAWAAHGRSAPVPMAADSVRMGTASVPPGSVPRTFALRPLANPFRDALELALDLPRASGVTLEVYDVAGRRLERIAAGELPAGTHRLRWRAGASPAGVYWAVARLDDRRLVRRVMRVP